MAARLAAPLLLFLLCVAFYWKLVLSNQYTWLDGPDTVNQVLPWFQFQAFEWQHGRFPAWDPYHWGGQSLIGEVVSAAAYPLNWLLFLLPLRNGWMRQSFLHWYYVLIHFQAALFCYWLCRDLRRSRGASIIAGLVFGLGGWMGTTDWPQMLNGAVWSPALFLFFLRAMRGLRPVSSSALAGVCLGMAFLSGHHQIPIFLGLVIGGCWLFYCWEDPRRWKFAAVFAVFLVASGALQALPAYEYGRSALRWAGASSPMTWEAKVPYHVHDTYSLFPISLVGLVIPGFFRHANGFVGVTALILAGIALIVARHYREVKLFAAVALGGLFLALGGQSILHGVLYSLVPLVEKARSPSMAILVFDFGLAVLTAFGIDSLFCLDPLWRKRIVGGLVAFGATIGLAVFAFAITKVPIDDRIGLTALVALLLAGLLSFGLSDRISARILIGGLAFLILFELANSSTWGYPNRDENPGLLPVLSRHGDIAEFLRQQPGLIRVSVGEEAFSYNFGDWHGIDQWGGYLASLTQNVAFANAVARAPFMYGTNYYIGSKSKETNYEQVFTSSSGLKVYRIPGAYPRSWVVHQAESIATLDGIGARFADPRFDPRRTVLLTTAAPALETCHVPDAANITQRGTQRVRISASLKCRGMLILGETYDRGWKATVDGQPARVYEAYGFLRGVVVEAGAHRVEMVYRPASLLWGAILTALALLAGAVLRWRGV